MPPGSRILRLLAFTVPALLAVCAVQPLLAEVTASLPAARAWGVAGPAFATAAVILAAARLGDAGDVRQPPWYAAWLLLPGAFLLAGAASMCVLTALGLLGGAERACWALLVAGGATWVFGLLWVRRASA